MMEWLNNFFKNNPSLEAIFGGFGTEILLLIFGALAWLVRNLLKNGDKSRAQHSDNIKKSMTDNKNFYVEIWDKVANILEEELPSLIEAKATQSRLAKKAGIDITRLNLDVPPRDAWHIIIDVAISDKKLDKLTEVIRKEYKDTYALKDVYALYDQAKSVEQSSLSTKSILSWIILIGIVLIVLWILPNIQQSMSNFQLSQTNILDSTDCLSVSNSPLSVGDYGQICLTQGADLSLRDSADGTEKYRPKNGTAFTVIGGPECAYYGYSDQFYFWWQVETTDGKEGWLVDGGDNQGDPIYLCHIASRDEIRRTSSEVVQAIKKYWALWGQVGNCLKAWDLLSESYQSDEGQDTYLKNCAITNAQVVGIIDLNKHPDSVVETRGQCVLVRIRLKYNDEEPKEMTFGLIRSAQAAGVWQIQSAYYDHDQACE